MKNSLRPKEAFQKTEANKFHVDRVKDQRFLDAVEAALLQMVTEQNWSPNVATQWDANSQLIGAKRFIDILLNLSEPMEKPKQQASLNLNHNV
jgi:hypothetical protein